MIKLRNGLPIFVDIDGTLTVAPHVKWGRIIPERVKAIQALIGQGHEVVLWSGGGTKYAEEFARRCGFVNVTCIGKPQLIVDDNPTIRPKGRMNVVSPEDYFG